MKRISALAVLAGGMLAAATAVQAADLIIDEPAPVIPAAAPASGWYIRGDLGYNFKSSTDGDWDFWNQFDPPARGIDDTFRYDEFSLKGSANFGAGVGYRFNEMLRGDLTLDYFRAGIDGRTDCPSYVKMSHGLSPIGDNCHYEDSSTASVWAPMANVYVDLPKLGDAVTPYLGAGLGMAHVKYDTWDTHEVCAVCTYGSDKEGLGSWRFAMGLMAGVSHDLSDKLKLDLGYRYLRIDGGDAYGYDAADRSTNPYGSAEGPGATGAQARDNGFNLHTVRLGLRYEFN